MVNKHGRILLPDVTMPRVQGGSDRYASQRPSEGAEYRVRLLQQDGAQTADWLQARYSCTKQYPSQDGLRRANPLRLPPDTRGRMRCSSSSTDRSTFGDP